MTRSNAVIRQTRPRNPRKAVSTTTKAEHPRIAWSSMAKTRERLSHHYHRVDQNLLWNVATTDIPALVGQLRTDKST